jgi:ribosome-associated translation inhibitor RaiA/cold shock CspA family protein
MDLHIEGQHTTPAPATQAWIRQRLEGLDQPDQDIIHARVTLVKHERHQKGSEEVRIVVSLPGKTLSAVQNGDTLDDALYGAFDVMERTLREFREVRRGVVKGAGPRPRGRIVRLFPDREYGFIETESHREVYFHAHAVHGLPFDKLAVGMGVDLEIEAGHAGPQASQVIPHTL